MTGGARDGHIDQLVKARWLAIGLSQTDLAEVLGAAFLQTPKDDNGPDGTGASRLMQVAEELDIPLALFSSHPVGTGQDEPDHPLAENLSSLQSLLELRLLRAFHELRDHRTKRMLIRLAEQIVKRQADPCGDAG
jgi:transcriptional regulator with XRE-family HTH domain